MRARHLIPLLVLPLLAAAPASAAPGLGAQRARAREVNAQVAAINTHLDAIVQAWDGARVRLGAVDTQLRVNEGRLRAARANLSAALVRIQQRLVELYVSPTPSTLAVLAGSSSISDLIGRLEAVHVLTGQDAAIGRQAVQYEHAVHRTELELRRERRQRAATVARLSARRQTIASDLAQEQRLLASIHESIRTLEAQQAARERRLAELARERIAAQVEAARQQAAAQSLAPQAGSFTADPSSSDPAVLNPAPAPSQWAEAATIAARYLGVPYVWGGESPSGFDCSGLVSYVYAQLGVSLPHYTVSQWNATIPVPLSDIEPGDLVFFNGLGHVGIYIGNGEFIDAPHTGAVVEIDSLAAWMGSFDGAHRVP